MWFFFAFCFFILNVLCKGWLFSINYAKSMSKQSLFSTLSFLMRWWILYLNCVYSIFSFSSCTLAVWFIRKCSCSETVCFIWMFLLIGYLQKNLILICVILWDGTGPAYSHRECTSALKCLLSPRTQTGESLGVISHSVIILFRNVMGLWAEVQIDFRAKKKKTYWNVSLALIL